jgi:hypothetical protein
MHRKRWAEVQSGVVWHGHVADLARLLSCVETHCRCGEGDRHGEHLPSCQVHDLVADQHAVDRLAFALSMRERLVRSEWAVDGGAPVRVRVWHERSAEPVARPRSRRVRSRLLAIGLTGLLLVSLGAPLLTPVAHSQQPVLASWLSR